MHPLKKTDRIHKNRKTHREMGRTRTGVAEIDNMWGGTTEATHESREGTNEHNTGKATIENHSTIKPRPRHRPVDPSVGTGPSVSPPAPSKVIDSIFPVNGDPSVLDSPAPLSWYDRLPSCGPPPLGYRTNADPCDPGPEEAGVMIDLFEVGLFHAPLTAGVRLSEVDGIFDNGGKSADCKNTGGKCCTFC